MSEQLIAFEVPQPRLPRWKSALKSYLFKAQAEYATVQEDDPVCFRFAIGAIEAMTGHNPARQMLGYTSVKECLVALRRAGYGDHVDVVKLLYPEWLSIAFAQPGDIALVEADSGRPAFSLVQGEHLYVVTPTGIGLAPLASAMRAFRV